MREASARQLPRGKKKPSTLHALVGTRNDACFECRGDATCRFSRKSADAANRLPNGSRLADATRPGRSPPAGRAATVANRTSPARASSFPSALGRAGDDDGRVPVGKKEHLHVTFAASRPQAPIAKTPRSAETRATGKRTVDEEGGVTAVVDDDVERLGAPVEHLVGAPPVLLQGLALPGEHRGGVARDGGRGVVLGGEDVARAPAHDGTERDEGLDEHGGLDGHVERTGDVRALKGLGGAELLDHGHETGHLDLRELDLEATVDGVWRRRAVSGGRKRRGLGVSGRTRADARPSFESAREANTSGRSSPTAGRARASRPSPGRGGEAAGVAIATFVIFPALARAGVRTRSRPWPCP